jgi:2-desacetyl-2-hydroxyethyl bacteriochlorophyllide A dehydrogenase
VPDVLGRAVWFGAARCAELRETLVSEPGPHEVLVRATVSLISAGTEMLVYRGDATPTDLLPSYCEGAFTFPIKYGYQVVGRVERPGAEAGLAPGQRVFVRHPHQDVFTLRVDEGVVPLPDAIDDDRAAFFNLSKVALTAILESPVRIGEVVVVFGQGIIGSILTRLARRTAGRLIAVDPIPMRRELAKRYGADLAVAPTDVAEAVADLSHGRGADACFEVSGSPRALQSALDVTGTTGTITVVSYFGKRPVTLRLAPEFHFKRLRIVSTQAAPIPAALESRWDVPRRSEVVLDELGRLPIEDFMGARFPITEVGAAYQRLDRDAEHTLGVLLDYGARRSA